MAPTSLRFSARHGSVLRVVVLWALAVSAGMPAAGGGAGSAAAEGAALDEALQQLQVQGVDLFFSSGLVPPELRVEFEPTSEDPRTRLDELLAPHGLRVEVGPGGRLVVVAGRQEPAVLVGRVVEQESGQPVAGVRIVETGSVPGSPGQTETSGEGSFRLGDLAAGRHRLEARRPGYVVETFEVTVRSGEMVEVPVRLEAAPLALDEIVVTPSRISLLAAEPVSRLDLGRDEIFALPHFGDDIFRALTLLPGVAGEEVSARINIRGGRSDEVLVLLDEVELFEPYHLRDYSGRLSIVAPRILREVQLITGGFPAQYGDRMSGVLDMTSEQAPGVRRLLGIGVLNSEVGAAGSFRKRRGQWLASVRRSHLDVAFELLDIEEKPRYWDAFAKAEYVSGPGHLVGLHVLSSGDTLDFRQVDLGEDTEDYVTGYENSYLWLTQQSILGARTVVSTTVSAGRVVSDRDLAERDLDEDAEGFELFDRRRLAALGIKQGWSFDLAPRHFLRWGFEARRLRTDYDYRSTRQLDDPLEDLRAQPRTGVTEFLSRLDGDQYSLYLTDRWRPQEATVVEVGLRYDEQTLTRDRNVSPRFNVIYSPGQGKTLRAAWGFFFQSQRPYELQVEDGVTALGGAERTEQRVLSFEQVFGRRGDASARGLALRLEAYQRKIRNPRPRYENLFEPISVFPEIESDRVLFAPERSEGYGLEVSLRGRLGRVDWWASYSYSRVFDEIEGRDIPRRIDQPHAVKLDANFPLGEHWNVNLAWRYHTGWPTTAFAGRQVFDDSGEPEIEVEIGPIHGERLSSYHRLDARLSREWQRDRGTLGFFVEIQNLYNRENLAGFDSDLESAEDEDGELSLIVKEEAWGGFLPSFGITWEF